MCARTSSSCPHWEEGEGQALTKGCVRWIPHCAPTRPESSTLENLAFTLMRITVYYYKAYY